VQGKQGIIFNLIVICTVLLCSGCATRRGVVVSDLGNGTADYRAIQSEIRTGETELAITGQRLEDHIESGLQSLEQSISGGQGAAEEIGAIIQRVRSREVDPAILEEWRNSRLEAGNSGMEGESQAQGYDFILGGNPYLD